MYKVESRWPHQNSIKVEWNLGKRCNYDCSYCPKEIHDNFSPHTDVEILKKAIDKLCSIGKPIRLSFTGGEPTVHPKFEELLMYANYQENISFISVTTNGTRPVEWYRYLLVDQLLISLHFEYDTIPILDKIYKLTVGESCQDIPKNVIVQVMAHQDKMRDVRNAVSFLHSHQIPYNVRRVRWTQGDHDLFDDMRYDQKDLDWLLEGMSTVKPNTLVYYKRDKDGDKIDQYHANDIIKHHLNQYKGWTCNAGLESLMINWDGDVHRATCRVGGSLGNIYNGTFTIPTEPVTCDRNFCTCAADIPLTKEKL